jgi:putative phosphoribosyl transferase
LLLVLKEREKAVLFADRVDAGKHLASALKNVVDKDAIVLAIPRGGVVVGYEVAEALGLPLDVIIPRKIGAPSQPELAIGAMTEDGTVLLDERLLERLRVSDYYIKEESAAQKLEIQRRLKLYRGDFPYPSLANRDVILVDDGIATGSTMKAALASVRKRGAKTVVVAVPVGPPSTIMELEREADRVVCLHTPESFYAIGQFYRDFTQTRDEEVTRLLTLSRSKEVIETSEKEENVVRIPVDGDFIEGNLRVPAGAKGVVLFAHGSGSSRFSPRNKYVAGVLNNAGIATLLIDLLTRDEEQVDMRTRQFRFDIDLLTERLICAAEWLKKNPRTKNMKLGIFGSSTGAAAALIAAAKLPKDVAVVVSRGGRPDLAMEHLTKVQAPSLFIVGGRDTIVIDLNKKALAEVPAEKKLEIVPGATHLFEESGKLGEVAKLATAWFLKHLK